MPTVWVWKVSCVLEGVVPPFITAADIENAMKKIEAHLERHGYQVSVIQGVERVAFFQVETEELQADLFALSKEN